MSSNFWDRVSTHMSSLHIERTSINVSALPENLRKHLDPAAPAPLKLMAARGMLPVPPEVNVQILYQLSLGQDETVKGEAEKSFKDLPVDLLLGAVQKQAHDGVLDWVAELRANDHKVIEAVVSNNATHNHTVARIAKTADAAMCDIIATNQVRLLAAPFIIEQLYQNSKARMATVDRVVELAHREGVQLKGLPGLQNALDSGQDIFSGSSGDPEIENFLQEQAQKAEEDAKKLADLENLTRAEQQALLEEEEQEEEHVSSMLSDKISRMNISEKVRLATVGSREAINLLVRDPNKLVHMAAARSPRVQYPDIRRWAGNKTLPDGVVNYIANNREYTRHYEVMLGLVNNPKTPLRETLRFLNHIRTNDLKQLSRNRNVPQQVSRQAKQLSQKRSGG